MSRYTGQADFRHDQAERIGVLLVNLGTPDAPTPAAVRRYLAEFLWDPRVVEQPRWPWWLVLHGIILRLRPRKVARNYGKIWTEQGSPLLVHSQAQARALQSQLDASYPDRFSVSLAMRYGKPTIDHGLQQLQAAGTRRIIVLPLYPQYSATTSGSTFDAVSQILQDWRWVPDLRFIAHYHDDETYIQALAASIREYWQQHGQADKLVFSFHGLPQRYFRAGDPYFCECHKTARLLAETLQLDADRWQLTFQSRFGREAWLQPYTDHTLRDLARAGTSHVQVICPGFSADCLETLEEINEQNRALFLAAGGERFDYIPALNDRPDHIAMMRQLIENSSRDWLARPQEDPATRLARARQLGAER
jgi:ferrochelatase